MREPSGFNLKTDKGGKDQPGVLLLLIAAATVAAVASGAAELVTAFGFSIPHGFTMLAGILIGLPFGVIAARLLDTPETD